MYRVTMFSRHNNKDALQFVHMRSPQQETPRHGPTIGNFGARALRVLEDDSALSCYQTYKQWCERVGLPVADLQTWRLTTARIRNA